MMRIGFGKFDITPPVGTELGGYAGYRPCTGIHDPLFGKVIVLEQEEGRYALVALDLMCVDEGLFLPLAEALENLGIAKERLIACAIHSHAAPTGMVPGTGPLASLNGPGEPIDPAFRQYMLSVIAKAADAAAQAIQALEPFQVRTGRGAIPPVGSERHTGADPQGQMTVIQIRTHSGKVLTVHNFPCHPTVLSAANTQVSADFVAGIEDLLDCDMAVFLNGAAGDISTRFTRQESSFAECQRMAQIAAEQIQNCIRHTEFFDPAPLRGIHKTVTLEARQVETPEEAQKQLQYHTQRWKAAEAAGEDPATVRILKSYVEGAGVSLEFAQTMGNLRQFHLPVTLFRFAGVDFVSIPGELFSALQPPQLAVISYANGYYRYISGMEAYDAGYYESMGSILARGQGEVLIQRITQLHQQLNHTEKGE